MIYQEKETALINDGAECIPLQWIDTDKSEHLRRPGGSEVEPLHNARLVARGDLERGYSRTDSPTASRTGFYLTLLAVVQNGWTLESYDARTAFLQSGRIARELLFKLPRGILRHLA